MTRLGFQFVPYRRPLAIPLQTARDTWFEREGILVRLEDGQGRIGYGEVAPLTEFGSESLAAALDYFGTLGTEITSGTLEAVPEALPCCRFALGSAVSMIEFPDIPYALRNCALLPTGEAAFTAMDGLVRGGGFRDFKLKIGIQDLNTELALVNGLVSLLPRGGSLRLDANGALDVQQVLHWRSFLAGEDRIAFIEQPLPPGQESAMREIATSGELRIALDESVASLEALGRFLGPLRWQGPIIMKSSILGSPAAQREVLRREGVATIFSSVFETAIGLHAVLRLAQSAGTTEALGFGTIAFFADTLGGFTNAPVLRSETVSPEILDHVWETVCSEFVLS